MLKVKYSGVNDGKPYPVDMVAFKDGDSVSNLNVENGELKLNGEPVGGGSGGGLVRIDITEDDNGTLIASKTYDEISDIILSGALPYCLYMGAAFHLNYSPTLSEISTMTALPAHKFSSVYVKGSGNTKLLGIDIEEGDNIRFIEYTVTITT